MARYLRTVADETPLEQALAALAEARLQLDVCLTRVAVEAAKLAEQAESRRQWEGSDRRYLSVNDVAAELGMSKKFVYALIASNKLASVMIGDARRVKRTDLDRYLTSLHGAA